MEYKNIAILLTGNCNAKCTMCCDSRGIVKGETLSKENLEKILCDTLFSDFRKYVTY